MKKKILHALDLGSSSMCLSQLTYEHGPSLMKLALETVPARGMRQGLVSNLTDAAEQLNALVLKAESAWQQDIQQVAIGVPNSTISYKDAEVDLHGEAVHEGHIKQLDTLVCDKVRAKGKEPLHVIARHYAVDHREMIHNPLGLEGETLTGSFNVVVVNKVYLRDIVKLCNTVGLLVGEMYAESYVQSRYTLTEEQKNNGVAVIDIGGGSVNILVYQKGLPVKAAKVNFGGITLTEDIAAALNLAPEEAEKLKVFWGINQENRHKLTVKDIYGTSRDLTVADTLPILMNRIYSCAEEINFHLIDFKGKLGAGFVLLGGSSKLPGLKTLFERVFDIPVTVPDAPLTPLENPSLSLQQGEEADNGKSGEHSLSHSLLLFSLDKLLAEMKNTPHLFSKKHLHSFIDWLREIS